MSYVECLVLGLLYSGARYGHEIDKKMDQMQIRLWTKTNRATIYQSLKRIEKKGWVKTNIEKIGNMPERKIYELTKNGKGALQTMVAKGLASQEMVTFDYSIAIGWMEVLPKDIVLEQISKRKVFIKESINQFPLNEANDKKNYIGRRANIKFLRSYYEMELDWLEWLTKELMEEKNTK